MSFIDYIYNYNIPIKSNSLAENPVESIAKISAISAVPAILDIICRTTGMGFATVARVTNERWIACAVLDNINFGLGTGGGLKVETTLCHEVNQFRKEIVTDNFDLDPVYAGNHTPTLYGLKSYISIPIILQDGRFFGTLCAIDPIPARINNAETIGMFELYAELIAIHLHNFEQVATAWLNAICSRVSSIWVKATFISGWDAHSASTSALNAASVEPKQYCSRLPLSINAWISMGSKDTLSIVNQG